VFLASAELAAIAAVLGKLPTPEEYLEFATKIDSMAPEIYDYLNFDQVPEFLEAADKGRSLAREIVVQA
jgi:aconitate hydratase 2/2-methylisocitrate dehydratase